MVTPVFSASTFFVHFLVPALGSAASIFLLLRPASRWGLVDRPGGRKQHKGEIPVVGGIGMGLAFLLAMLWWSPMNHGQLYLLTGLMMLLALGVVDDVRDVSAKKKLLWQLGAALVMIAPSERYLHHLGDLFGFGPVELGALALPFTAIAIVGLINAVNMSDGIDGSAGGLVATSVLWLAVLAALIGRNLLALELTILYGVTVGFLLFNMRTPLRNKAAVFMGDAGSMMLGACLAWFAVNITQVSPVSGNVPPPIVVLWVLGLPVLDTVVLMCRRIKQGRSPFSAGRDHMHHIWTRAGFSVAQTTSILMGVNAVFGAIGVLGWLAGVPEVVLFVAYIGVLFLHRSLAKHAWLVSKWLRLHKQEA